MSQPAKKGDMALILPPSKIDSDGFTGLVVKCVSDPLIKPYHTPCGAYFCDVVVNEIEPMVLGRFTAHVVPTHRLLPLRNPDADVTRTADRKAAA